jgi:hypothetical protein
MPAMPPVPGVIRCQVDFLVGSDAAAMTRFHVTYLGGPPSAADMAAFASDLSVSCASDLPGIMHPDTSYESVTLVDLSSSTGSVGFVAAPTVGVRTGGPLPAGAAVLANYSIARRYRGGKPRGYWPLGTDTDLLTRQTWQSASISDFTGGIGNIVNGLDGLSNGSTTIIVPASVSFYSGFTSVLNIITGRTRDVPKLRTGGPVTDIIFGLSVNSHVSSQRRRNLIRN